MRAKLLDINFQVALEVLQEASAQLGIWQESFDVGTSALNSLALLNI